MIRSRSRAPTHTEAAIGIVTTWFERGAAYVSRAYKAVLEAKFPVFIYARGGERDASNDPAWNGPEVHRAPHRNDFRMDRGDFESWLLRHQISAVLFNEQQWWPPVLWAKEMGLQTIAYVDYYTKETVPWFDLFDSLWCNTRRHYAAFEWHPGAVYIPWGTDTETFAPREETPCCPPLVFFHSAGMGGHNLRKGTDLAVRAFVRVAGDARLVIHSQVPLTAYSAVANLIAADPRIEFLQASVPPPGMYHRGHVYVYPARLDGLGLTVPEAISCGLPVIATQCAPFTDFVHEGSTGWLVPVESQRDREDGYYWPETECSLDHLASRMQDCVDHLDSVQAWRLAARQYAVSSLDWRENSRHLCQIVNETLVRPPRRISRHVRQPILLGSGTGRADTDALTVLASAARSALRDGSLRIARVQICDKGGAMATPARISQGVRAAGHHDLLVVRDRDSDRPHSFALLHPDEPGPAEWRMRQLAEGLRRFAGRVPGAGRLYHLLTHQAPARLRARTSRRRQEARRQGHEIFEYPATWNLLNRLPWKPDILHLHNLHGGYFDLRALPRLTRQIPTVLTLHDAWLFAGHCAYPMGCERWRTGCGQCPDLTIYPAIEKDATAYNWDRKRRIYAKSRMHVVGVSQKMLDMARESMLAPAMLSSRVIPNGLDVGLFSPGDRRAARDAVGLPQDAHVLVFVASNFLKNRFKDWATIRGVAETLGRRELARPVVLAAIGDSGPTERLGRAEVRLAGTVRDQALLAQWYRAADICVHAARGESFCVAIAEGRACGAPTVATAVDGIPEQVRSLTDRYTGCPVYDHDQATGILVPPGDPEAMADAAAMLLSDDALRARLSANAVRDTRERFSNQRMVREYLELYEEALGGRGKDER